MKSFRSFNFFLLPTLLFIACILAPLTYAEDAADSDYKYEFSILISGFPETSTLDLKVALASTLPDFGGVYVHRINSLLWLGSEMEQISPVYVIDPVPFVTRLRRAAPVVVGFPIPQTQGGEFEVMFGAFNSTSQIHYSSIPPIFSKDGRTAYVVVHNTTFLVLVKRKTPSEFMRIPLKEVQQPTIDSCELDEWASSVHLIQPLTTFPYMGEKIILFDMVRSAFEAYQSIGFRPPVLQRVLTKIAPNTDGSVSYTCGFGINPTFSFFSEALNGNLGLYDPVAKSLEIDRLRTEFYQYFYNPFCCVLIQPPETFAERIRRAWLGRPLEPKPWEYVFSAPTLETLGHELFHAVQYAYLGKKPPTDDIRWMMEGTARLAQGELFNNGINPGNEVVRDTKIERRILDEGLLVQDPGFANQTQDFWYDLIARQLKPYSNKKFAFLKTIFEEDGLSLKGLDVFLKKRQSSLSRAYLSWALHQIRQVENFENTKAFYAPRECASLDDETLGFTQSFAAKQSQALRTVLVQCEIRNTSDHIQHFLFQTKTNSPKVSVLAYKPGWMNLIARHIWVAPHSVQKINVLMVNANFDYQTKYFTSFKLQAINGP